MRTYFIFIFSIVFLKYSSPVGAQIPQEPILGFINSYIEPQTKDHNTRAHLATLYKKLNYNWVWLKDSDSVRRKDFLEELDKASNIGLREGDYKADYIKSIFSKRMLLRTSVDSLIADIKISDAAISFYHAVFLGNNPPVFGYNGLDNAFNCNLVVIWLADHLLTNDLQSLASNISPLYPEIFPITNKMKWFNKILQDVDYREEKIISTAVRATNKALILKLFQLGITDVMDTNLSEKTINTKLKEAQRLLNLQEDGQLNPESIQQLNVPITTRFSQLSFSLNYFRWLQTVSRNQSVIVANIPAAYLKVYKDYRIIFETKLIVGKKTTPTPTLSSRLTEVVLYPYWHVPNSIATKELLPLIKRNPGFLDISNFQVLTKTGKIINPHSINWSIYSSQYFPFIIRQSTGCDNSLGLLKLNFYNPIGVYLHDTPTKNLFSAKKRFFSHGCMRMENPFGLARLVLKNNTLAIDTLEKKGCTRNQSPVTVVTAEKMPVIVWYNPAGVDSLGRVILYEDVYSKFNWMKQN